MNQRKRGGRRTISLYDTGKGRDTARDVDSGREGRADDYQKQIDVLNSQIAELKTRLGAVPPVVDQSEKIAKLEKEKSDLEKEKRDLVSGNKSLQQDWKDIFGYINFDRAALEKELQSRGEGRYWNDVTTKGPALVKRGPLRGGEVAILEYIVSGCLYDWESLDGPDIQVILDSPCRPSIVSGVSVYYNFTLENGVYIECGVDDQITKLLLKIRGEGEIGDRVRFDDLEDPMGVNELLGYTGATVTLGEVYKCKNNLGWRKTDGTVFPLSFVVISS